ncbi:DUF805 domain-containing protein [Coraliomargarita akajimensis]|uniref:DUF805 domain-containing protein n=1 Tax=Coraliomargarita akajimensis (strain DSM 45221 / IAM 15411 / JCM 23193 / KCTC 12865 / 04OKA010-24) TaxID=583355 RepID=D5EIV1_CORAD|nr:DUF805 domain-containing protein [Coraliomargarita akajimensis]ADE54350.1 protein of unknown function DUF805 [Coraliomargarita akajimensis DSM 45221]
MTESFFSSEGRIGRLLFAGRVLLLLLLTALVFFLGIRHFSHDEAHAFLMPLAYFAGVVASVFATFGILMNLIKRLHDMNKPVILSALIFVPGVNVLMVLYASLVPGVGEE